MKASPAFPIHFLKVYSYCKTHHSHNFGKHRLVINHRTTDLSDAATSFMCNKLNWQAGGITRI